MIPPLLGLESSASFPLSKVDQESIALQQELPETGFSILETTFSPSFSPFYGSPGDY